MMKTAASEQQGHSTIHDRMLANVRSYIYPALLAYKPCMWRAVFFCRYLADKGRAGVIKLESQYARSLYLVPPSPSVCQSLGVTWEPSRDAAALLAIVVPAAVALPGAK